MIATSNPLPEVIRAQVVARLQTTLSSLLSCAAVVWTAHWNIRGIDYEGVHKRFGKIVDDAHGAVDSVAEMMRQLGGSRSRLRRLDSSLRTDATAQWLSGRWLGC